MIPKTQAVMVKAKGTKQQSEYITCLFKLHTSIPPRIPSPTRPWNRRKTGPKKYSVKVVQNPVFSVEMVQIYVPQLTVKQAISMNVVQILNHFLKIVYIQGTEGKEPTASELRRKYPKEYNSWSNAKYNRCGKDGESALHPAFYKFPSLLKHVGPMPGPSYTLDKIDYSNPEYSPNNCRWASKKLQSRNRRNTKHLTDPESGKTLPLVEWADRLETPRETLRSRVKRGWTDGQVLHGKSYKPSSNTPSSTHTPPKVSSELITDYFDFLAKHREEPSDDDFVVKALATYNSPTFQNLSSLWLVLLGRFHPKRLPKGKRTPLGDQAKRQIKSIMYSSRHYEDPATVSKLMVHLARHWSDMRYSVAEDAGIWHEKLPQGPTLTTLNNYRMAIFAHLSQHEKEMKGEKELKKGGLIDLKACTW